MLTEISKLVLCAASTFALSGKDLASSTLIVAHATICKTETHVTDRMELHKELPKVAQKGHVNLFRIKLALTFTSENVNWEYKINQGVLYTEPADHIQSQESS